MSAIIDTIQENDFVLDIHDDGDVMVTTNRSGYFLMSFELIKRCIALNKKHEAARNIVVTEVIAKAKKSSAKDQPAPKPLSEKAQVTKTAVHKRAVKK